MAGKFGSKINNTTTPKRDLSNVSSEALGVILSEVKDEKYLMVPTSILDDNPYQPRKNYSELELQELAESIKEDGLLQPITVRARTDEHGRFYIVAGHRRKRAHDLLGLTKIKAIVKNEITDLQMRILSLAENIQREDLDPFEEGDAYKQANLDGMSFNDLAKAVGKSKSRIINRAKLSSMSDRVRNILIDIQSDGEKISGSVLEELVGIENPALLDKILKEMKSRKLTRDDIRMIKLDEKKSTGSRANHPNLSYEFKQSKTKISINFNLKQISEEKKSLLLEKIEEIKKLMDEQYNA